MKTLNERKDSWWDTSLSRKIKKRRAKMMEEIMGDIHSKEVKILDVGCANGKDFIQHYKESKNISFTGIDLKDRGLKQDNFKLILEDAQSIPFEDNYFDFVISMGLLEHIAPIEKLCKVISEIDRVGRRYCIVVPSIITPIEPHTRSIYWQLRNRKKKYPSTLNYFSDEAWLSFNGFKKANIKRYWYIPLIKRDTVIYN